MLFGSPDERGVPHLLAQEADICPGNGIQPAVIHFQQICYILPHFSRYLHVFAYPFLCSKARVGLIHDF